MSVDFQELDRQIYEQELRDFLPAKIFDAHVHLLDSTCALAGAQWPARSPFLKFGGVFTLEQWLAWTRALLLDQDIHANSFGVPSLQHDRDRSALYTGSISDNRRFFGMALVSPHDRLADVVRRVTDNRLLGYKPYIDFVDWKQPADVTIHDMLPPAQMQYADEHGLIVTLHIPRPARLADPLNQAQMVELCRNYPGAAIIFAHIGRAYYLRNVVGFLDGIAACPNAYLDTAMVNHEGVLEYAFRVFPRERILFGSDAPVAFLRGKSVEINNRYAYLMGEDYAIGATLMDTARVVDFTSFFYEQLRGIKLAAQRAGLSRSDIEDLFFNNANRLFRAAAARNPGNTP